MTLEPLIIESDQSGRNMSVVNAWMLHWSPSNVDELQSRVLSAGWQWRLVSGPDSEEIAAVGHRVRARFNEAKARPGSWAPPLKVLLAVGPGGGAVSAELQMIVRLGRAVGVIVVAASELLDSDRSPADFRDSFTGYWAPFVPRTGARDASSKSVVKNRI